MITVVCSWCGIGLGVKEGDTDGLVSHSICNGCKNRLEADMALVKVYDRDLNLIAWGTDKDDVVQRAKALRPEETMVGEMELPDGRTASFIVGPIPAGMPL